jgi:RHS repeat-associated protein
MEVYILIKIPFTHPEAMFNQASHTFSKPIFRGGSGYRFTFNGKEDDKETQTQDYGMRIYDSRLGRFLSVDPLFKNFVWNSSYSFAENDIIRCLDLEGMEKSVYTNKFIDIMNPVLKVIFSSSILKKSLYSDVRKPELEDKISVYYGIVPNKGYESLDINGNENGFTMDLGALSIYLNDHKGSSDKKTLAARQFFTDVGINPIEIYNQAKSGKNVVGIFINEKMTKEIRSNDKALADFVKTLAHEVDLHLKDKINGNNRSSFESHSDYYNINVNEAPSQIINYLFDGYSIPDKMVDPKSRAGKNSSEIDRTIKRTKRK